MFLPLFLHQFGSNHRWMYEPKHVVIESIDLINLKVDWKIKMWPNNYIYHAFMFRQKKKTRHTTFTLNVSSTFLSFENSDRYLSMQKCRWLHWMWVWKYKIWARGKRSLKSSRISVRFGWMSIIAKFYDR